MSWRLGLGVVIWGLLNGTAGILAGLGVWAAVIPLAVVLVVTPILWVGNELANRIETHGLTDDRRYTGKRHG